MPTGNKAKLASGHVEPKEDPDERLKLELLRIAEADYIPEQNHARGFAEPSD